MNPVFYAIHRRVNVDISLLWETGTLLRVDEDGQCFRFIAASMHTYFIPYFQGAVACLIEALGNGGKSKSFVLLAFICLADKSRRGNALRGPGK